MIDFLQQNWVWILFVVAMLAMQLGGHGHGAHGGHSGMGGCGGHSVSGSGAHQGHHEHAGSHVGDQPLPKVPDPTRDAHSPDDLDAGARSQRIDGASEAPQRHRHGC